MVVHEEALAEAVAAVGAADVVDQDQRGVPVLVLDPLRDGDGRLVAGVELAALDHLSCRGMTSRRIGSSGSFQSIRFR